jgi:hypothetical protein
MRRYFEVQRIALPWLLLLLGVMVVAVFADALAGPNGRIGAVLLLGLPTLLGMFFAMGTYLFAVIRADVRKHRLARTERPSR